VTPYEQKKRDFRDGMVFQPSAAPHLYETTPFLHAMCGPGDVARFERLAKMQTTISSRGRVSVEARDALIRAVNPAKAKKAKAP
jgi:hypothetical protein